MVFQLPSPPHACWKLEGRVPTTQTPGPLLAGFHPTLPSQPAGAEKMLRAQPVGVRKACLSLYPRARHGVITRKFPSQITIHDTASSHLTSAVCQARGVILFNSFNNPPYDVPRLTDENTEAGRSSGICWGEGSHTASMSWSWIPKRPWLCPL